MSAVWLVLSELDARVLRATDARYVCTVERVAERAGCGEDVARSVLRRLRVRMLVEDDGRRPSGWLRTYAGEVALEHQP
jgi:ribosomal protein S25